ncbi:yrdc domain-containing protein, mitochondrial [Plakobranchus ocellatus]|uniref:Threonylcarbamoyl-AMP synthase n=1 Tax=Plakobranchus ocellatus TaxID=259542 RepID=A0AAV4AAP3_9GAST|nr:yrdc domain-containing protein, mitochondrial [Plakobranchus ocellatus]
MAVIRSSTATIATLYTHAIIFVVVAVFNFSIAQDELPINVGYGLALLLLSLISLLMGITSQDPQAGLLRSLLMCVSALWTATGLVHVMVHYTGHVEPDSKLLFAGYGTFILVFLFYVLGSLHHSDRTAAVIALGMFLSLIFDTASLWRPVRGSAAAYYLLLAAVTLYLTVSRLWARLRGGEISHKFTSTGREESSSMSRDYVPVGHAMNTLAAAVYAGQVTGIYDHASLGFAWVMIAGLYLLVAAVVAVRRGNIYNGLYFLFHATFWLTNGFNLSVVFVSGNNIPQNLIAATVLHFIVFFIIAMISLTREVYQLPQNLALCVMCVAILEDDNNSGAFLGAMGWILFVFSLYGLAAHISRVKNSGLKLPLGAKLVNPEQLTNFLIKNCKCCLPKNIINLNSSGEGQSKKLFNADFTLGYSRYSGFEVAGFALNAITAVAVLWTPEGLWVLPWAIVLGGVAQWIVGSICFSKGLSFESCAFFTFGAMWLIWGPARELGQLDRDNSPAIITGCVGFLSVGLLLLGLSTTINKSWTALTFMFNLVLIGEILHGVSAPGAFIYEIVITVIFVVVCIYCFLATALRSVWGRELLPLGKPFLQVSYLHSEGEQAFWADGRTASGVKAIADIMNRGGICGIPTDTVYTLVSAVKFPESVERAYNTKLSAEDRPMSMWISKVDQLSSGRELFGELVWGLMNEIWPSTVSLVVPKGDWLQTLRIGSSEKYIGRPDSIACRMPDNTVTSHLIDQTGPIAVSSANPTGEADTTHHLQVLAKLGKKNCDGILCSGPSPENMASTVVDCRKLGSDGSLAFFRVGVVPRSQVEAIFAKVKAFHDGGSVPPSMTDTGHVNAAYRADNDDEEDGDGGNNITIESIYSIGVIPAGQENSPPSERNQVNQMNMNFAESTADDGANLIDTCVSGSSSGSKFMSEAHPNGISGRMNKAYESLAESVVQRLKSSVKSRNSNGDVTSHTSFSLGRESPYEPMDVISTRSGAEIAANAKIIGGKIGNDSLTPVFTVNPLFVSSTKTKL